ncbi:MAG TPA: hypothetical protein ENJ95_19640 [Bacteroidetes bacterium]|nr:hypothetical protein [Bacteroidota bacterium]
MQQHYKALTFRFLLILFFLNLYSQQSISQIVDFNKIVTPEGQRPANFEDYLVQLAWLNSPQTQILNFEKTKEEMEVDLKRTEWMDDMSFSFNINEVSLENVLAPDPNNFVLYPLYQFSAAVSLGSFTNTKKERKLEEVDVKIAEMEANEHKMSIRAETLFRYNKLLLAIETLKVRVKAEEVSKNTFDLAQRRFKNAELDMEDMLRASESYSAATEKRLSAETNIELAKLSLEEMIGVKWEVAKRFEGKYKKSGN